MILFYLILCGLLSIALLTAVVQISQLRRKLKEMTGLRDDYEAAWKQLQNRRIKSKLQMRCNGRDVPMYMPVATITADGIETIDGYEVIRADGSLMKQEKFPHPVKMCAGEELTVVFELAVDVTK